MTSPWRRLTALVAAAIVALTVSGCNDGKPAAATSTPVPQALWLGQAHAWLAAHGSDLTDISTSAKNLADAAKSGDNRLTQVAVSQFLTTVGRADGDLPSNEFASDMHHVFIDYATALSMIRKGLVNGSEKTYKAGSRSLATAVTEFAAITNRLQRPA